MHAVIINDLEEYLSGSLPPSALHRFEAHLKTCDVCAGELHEMVDCAGLFASLKLTEALEPPPGFTARFMQTVSERPVPSFWAQFGDFAFGRRVVFASLLTMAALGTFLISSETSYTPAPPTPEAVMADNGASTNADQMLATLANYEP